MIKILMIFISITFKGICSVGLPDSNQENFKFFVNSDPQMGEQFSSDLGIQELNGLLNRFTIETNNLSDVNQPDFVVFNGDLVWKPNQESFDNFERLTEDLVPATVLVHGNHDGNYPDTKFLDLQERLSGYRNYHYSFDYGRWHFVVIGAPEQYPSQDMKDEMLNWLNTDLGDNSDKNIMLFMHYNIMPAGLSESEFYTYTPISFKNQLLDTIVDNNVDYVVSGHVHAGIKASVKTMLAYKNTNFLIAPTPVLSRMFGEEFPNMVGTGTTRNKGYFAEFQVNGDELKIYGRKIGSSQRVTYPMNNFKTVDKNIEIRSFVKEGDLKRDYIFHSDFHNHTHMLSFNNDFLNGLDYWNSSYRYITDDGQNFINYVDDNNVNRMVINAKMGGWTKEEYLENYQIINYEENSYLNANFYYPMLIRSGGAYIKIAAYDANGNFLNTVLLHWGKHEELVRYLPQIWGYMWYGERTSAQLINTLITQNRANTFTLPITQSQDHILSISIDNIFSNLIGYNDINHFSLSYGIWTRHNEIGTPFRAEIRMNNIGIYGEGFNSNHPILFNNNYIPMSLREDSMDYGMPYLN